MTSATPKLSVFQSRQKTENLSVMLVYLWDRITSLFPCPVAHNNFLYGNFLNANLLHTHWSFSLVAIQGSSDLRAASHAWCQGS